MISGILSIIFFLFIFGRLVEKVPYKTIIKIFVVCALFATLALHFFSNPIPFPEQHTLEIIVLEDSKPQETSFSDVGLIDLKRPIHVISMNRVYQPANKNIGIDLSDIEISGDWQVLPDKTILWEGGESGTLKYQGFMQAGVEIVFKTGYEYGNVIVKWDGIEKTLALNELDSPSYTEYLAPIFNMGKADSTRKIFVISALTAEFFGLTSLLTIFSIWIFTFIKKNILVRNPYILAGSAAILILLFISTFVYIQPIHFVDGNLEVAIQEAIGKPNQPIFNHQLMTIATLDASGRNIHSLDGIEGLRNLSELKSGKQ